MRVHCGAILLSVGRVSGVVLATLGAANAQDRKDAVVPPITLQKPADPKAVPSTSPQSAPKPDPAAVTTSAPAAKQLFGAARGPAPLAARAIGTYAKGCLSGGVALPIDGDAWQAMRLSRNRNWGHPRLVTLLRKFAAEVKAHDGWPGLLLGDISQPRGGPMLTGHASHQIGLDADIWLTPMPTRRLSREEREEISATSMLTANSLSVDPQIFTDGHVRVLKRAASYGEVERVLVHPAIKKALCERTAKDADRKWLHKVRPIWGHHYHFHIRMSCPEGSAGCVAQKPVPGDDGCGKELEDWMKLLARPKKQPDPNAPKVPVVPAKPKPEITVAQLPSECRIVLDAPAK